MCAAAPFSPIAVVGRGCVLPGAEDPAALWSLVRDGRDVITPAPEGRWDAQRRRVLRADGIDGAWTDRGGHVADGAGLDELRALDIGYRELTSLDSGTRWLLAAARQALQGGAAIDVRRAGLAVGNLSFPTQEMSRWCERAWLGPLAEAAGVRPVAAPARFMSGRPALKTAKVLGFEGPCTALDAACASALYAIGHACDLLHAGEVDAMLAGAVNQADDLLIHIGFCALKALSTSGQSRPFDRAADGLVPASGAGLVLLKRLEDARRDGDEVLAVIRGIGLSNDGRGRGFLAPSAAGQRRAMEQAYARSGLSPTEVGLLECHATGTQLGDRTEVLSSAKVFAGAADLPVGSLKSNMGHLITAAGVAGLLKVIAAMEHRVRPPTLHVDEPIDALEGTPLRLLRGAEPWPDGAPLRAAVSAFGFGGNNAHLVVEHPSLSREKPEKSASQRPAPAAPLPRLAVIGVGARVGAMEDAAALGRCLETEHEPNCQQHRASHVTLSLQGLRAPPADLQRALPQQLAFLAAARDALGQAPGLDLDRVSVLAGIGCDTEVSRRAARWRLPDRAARLGLRDPGWLEAARTELAAPLDAATLLGCMPNIPANRLNHHLGITGPSMTVSAEELSGLAGLRIAQGWLRSGLVDAALVGAAELAAGAAHEEALHALGCDLPTGDAAVALLVSTAERAAEAGWPVLGWLTELPASAADATEGQAERLAATVGRAHAAWGAVQLTAALWRVAGHEGARHDVRIDSILGGVTAWRVEGGPALWPDAELRQQPLLSVPAHGPPPVLPALPVTPPVSAPAEGLSPRALPRRHPGADSALALTPVVTRAPAPARSAVTPAAHPAVQLATQQLHHLAAAHADFLRLSAAAHERFLQHRGTAAAAFVRARVASTSSAPTPTPTPVATIQPTALTRSDLEVHASGRISTVFGPAFEGQDGYRRQVRMPTPPLLLCDRVLDIQATPRSMGKGTIITETDVLADAWHLHDGRMPAGIMIEAGQADLVLISWLGIDFENRGERVYRLLGCDLTYRGGLLRPGDTIRYAISCDGHAKQGNIGLFFFHYDGEVDGQVRIQVRNGQAGFFTDADLAASRGILWRPEDATPTPDPTLDPPPAPTAKRALSHDDLRAFAAGDIAGCFGPSHVLSKTATRPPRIAGGDMLLLHEVTHLELPGDDRPGGGPWGRGYLRAVDWIAEDDWFFSGHFHNDPCMPGTLMFEGCLQAMAVYLTAMGLGLRRDGWRFEPVPDVSYPLRCRGQVLPTSKELVYEVFVDEVVAAPWPTLWADILCTVDGLPAFWCKRMGLQLRPGWPLDDPNFTTSDSLSPWSQRIQEARKTGQIAQIAQTRQIADIEGMPLDYEAMMATAWGAPSAAFGPMYRPFDEGRPVARLPGPPYHFMSRAAHVDAPPGLVRPGVTVAIDWDIPTEAFFYEADGNGAVPFCVFLEAALQPCGWLASYVGCATTTDEPLFFRNLDGTGTWTDELLPGAGTLRTRTTLTSISKSGGMILVSFDVTCTLGERVVYTLQTGFGFFPAAALAHQAGLAATERWTQLLHRAPNRPIALHNAEHTLFRDAPTLPAPGHAPSLLMLQEAPVADPTGGEHGLGQYRGYHDVDPGAWYFKAHFFQDPVQPGSLGLEAISQLLRLAMRDKGLHEGMTRPRFRAATGQPLTWTYRGQVLPTDRRVTVAIELTRVTAIPGGVRAAADGTLSVDGRRIYEATGFTMDLVDAPAPAPGTSTVG